ncbi:TPA: GTP-binding protein [Klebsiella pneumoniae]|nr:GTP-binding protein [Klebsiella pneumoniae]HBW7283005.1 GTP-binding protein [Klebsiella pneumoniae]HBW7294207.1 GTP-binding protein [Klebsiella pneumoniae]HBW8706133.1 GTP-binding protein [Klebsiella pneumoniae]
MINERQIAITVITGYLGSGKTTLLNHMLSKNEGAKIAVIVNEFGEMSIDAKLLVKHSDEQLIEFNNGCLCCTVRGDLIDTINQLRQRTNDIDYIIIETTGLADPAPVASTFFVSDDISRCTQLDAFIAVVDAVNIDKNLASSTEANEQIAFSDIIILNKADLVTPERLQQVRQRIRTLNPLAHIHVSEFGRVDIAQLMNTRGFSLTEKLKIEPDLLTDHTHEHDQSISTLVLRERSPLDINRFMSWMTTLLEVQGDKMIRTKGLLNAKGFAEPVVFQSVRMLTALNQLNGWPEKTERASELVVIGKDLNPDLLKTEFSHCVYTPRQGVKLL